MVNREMIIKNFSLGENKDLDFGVFPGENPATDPIFIVFHGHTGRMNILRDPPEWIIPQQMYKYPGNWNVIVPQDRHGGNKFGSWWLGEEKKFFMVRLLDEMLSHIRGVMGMAGPIYTFGTSMGGFAALLYGFRWGASGISVNCPQVRVLGTDYASGHYFHHIFGVKNDEELWNLHASTDPGNLSILQISDSTNFINKDLPKKRKPTLLITQSRYDVNGKNYTKQECMYLVNKLVEADYNFELHVYPEIQHKQYFNTFNAIEWFIKNRKIIEEGL